MYLLSRLVGVIFIALGAYICLHAFHLFNLSQEMLSTSLHRPLTREMRLTGGFMALPFGLGFIGYGLRYILKPIRANEQAY